MSATNEPNIAAIRWAEKRAATILLKSTKQVYWLRHAHLNKVDALAGQVDNPRTRLYDRAASRFCLSQEILSAHLADDIELVDALWADIKQIDDETQINNTKKKYTYQNRIQSVYNNFLRRKAPGLYPDDFLKALLKAASDL